jgi:hypothetical protein
MVDLGEVLFVQLDYISSAMAMAQTFHLKLPGKREFAKNM